MRTDSNMLQGIIRQPLSSVNFTMDYLTLDFNETRLTFGLMPKICTETDELESTSDKYADALRGLIGEAVADSEINDLNEYQLRFQKNTELKLELVDAKHEVLSISGPNGFELIK